MVNMPWPVTHVLTAEIFYDGFFSHLDRKEFIIGTCFPDIRYPARLNRKSTHIKHLPLSDIQSQSAFRAGLLFHSYVDEMWNALILERNAQIFEEIPHDQPMIHTMKVLQDKFLYDHIEGWDRIADYFDSPLPEERTYGASQGMIQHWHDLLANYLRKPPVIQDLDMLSISLSPEMIAKIRTYYLTFQNNSKLTRVLSDYYDRAVAFYQEEIETHSLVI
jgi:hypothetical protein